MVFAGLREKPLEGISFLQAHFQVLIERCSCADLVSNEVGPIMRPTSCAETIQEKKSFLIVLFVRYIAAQSFLNDLNAEPRQHCHLDRGLVDVAAEFEAMDQAHRAVVQPVEFFKYFLDNRNHDEHAPALENSRGNVSNRGRQIAAKVISCYRFHRSIPQCGMGDTAHTIEELVFPVNFRLNERHTDWPHRLMARTAPFHGVNRGSIPRGATTTNKKAPEKVRGLALLREPLRSRHLRASESPSQELSCLLFVSWRNRTAGADFFSRKNPRGGAQAKRERRRAFEPRGDSPWGYNEKIRRSEKTSLRRPQVVILLQVPSRI